MEAERREHEKYECNIKALLRYSGLWIDLNPTVKLSMACIAFLSNFLMALAVLNFCIHHANNIIILTKGMGLVISLFTVCLKVAIFLRYQEDLTYLHENLTARYFEDMKEPANRPRLLSRIQLYSKFFWVCSVAVLLAVVMYTVISLFAYAKHGKYLRVFPAIYPLVGKPAGFTHWFFFAFEVIAGSFLFSVTAGVDCSFGMYSFQMCGQLRLLADKFESLKATPDYKAQVKNCIERHQMLYRSKKKLENLFGIIAIWFTVTASIVLCSLIFQFSQAMKSKASLLQFNLLIMYIVLKIMQIFTFTFYGNAISEESKLCLDSVYNADWSDKHDKNFRNDILIVLNQKPVSLIAKGCMLIQLDMFAKIMNTSISYFFLLQTLEEGS